MLMDDFLWLQKWYQSHCNGDWEHDQRIRISTIDNPGWSITINLIDTELEDKQFIDAEKDLSETDWYMCFIKSKKFEGVGSSENLPEILKIFRKWVESIGNKAIS